MGRLRHRLLKKPQLLGDEERRTRRSVSYAAVMSDEGNNVAGALEAACSVEYPLMTIDTGSLALGEQRRVRGLAEYR